MAQSEEGCEFANWTEGGIGVSVDASFTFSAEGDRELVANFQLIGGAVLPGEIGPEEPVENSGAEAA